MRIRTRLVTLFLFVVLFICTGRITTGNFEFFFKDFWFNAGILTLVLGALIDQPFYSRDDDILLNGVAASVSLLTITSEDRHWLWWTFQLFALYLVASSYVVMYIRSQRAPHQENNLLS